MAFIVVLDAGHGGKDPGALGTYSKEKNINLNVVLRLGKLIKENCRDVTVIYTRQTDKFVELFERANIANNAKADLFISVHTNATTGNSTLGTETYSLTLDKAATNMEVVKRENSVIQYENNQQRYSANSLESKIMSEVIMSNNMRTSALFAKSLQDEYRKIGRPNRGVHQQNFHVLRQV
ncbi:MAG: N-acetylmuramoyl-L-alanine amidase, partial [Bacteroidaceae bacterium]